MEFPRIPWAEFPARMDWRQGEHVTLIAPTGQGKTTLAKHLLPLRQYVMLLATKKRDDTLHDLKGYKAVKRVTPDLASYAPRIIVQAPYPKDPEQMFRAHSDTFRQALTAVYNTGGWTVFADEVRYLCQQLKLQRYLELLWLQGRSLGVSVIAATQRPRHIPLEAYDAATHLFLWRDSDMNNVQRIAEIGGVVDTQAIMSRVPELPQYQFVYVNTRNGNVIESKVE